MAVDLQVVHPQNVIPLSSIVELAAYTPRALDIGGDDFSAVDDVEINDQPSPQWTVINRHRLIAQVPLEDTGAIYNVNVISNRLTFTRESLLRFKLGNSPGKVTGMMRLIQMFVKVLLTTPGTDIWNPRMGGGLLSKIGNRGGAQGKGLVGDATIAVDNTSIQLMAMQAQEKNIPPTERLLSASVTQAKYNQYDLSLDITIELLNQALRKGFANINT